MNLTYKTSIKKLLKAEAGEYLGLVTGVVVAVEATDSDNHVATQEVLLGIPRSSDTLVPWELLTESLILSWVENYFPKKLKQQVYATLEKTIKDQQQNLKIADDFPWDVSL